MLQGILDVDELVSDQQERSRKLTELQFTLTNFAAEGAKITAQVGTEARNEFLNIRCQQWIRNLQVEVFASTGTLEGSLQRAFGVVAGLG